MRDFVVIADDFTGANDTGVQIRAKGIPIDVVLEPQDLTASDRSVVIDTESRVVTAAEAYRRVRDAFLKVQACGGCRHVYKKVDSTLRGHLREEIQALIAVYEPEIIVFAPAFPDQGRTVREGRLCVHGTPLLDTELVTDPRNPVREDKVASILAEITGRPVRHRSGDALRNEKEPLDGAAFSFDTETNEDLAAIAGFFLKTGKRVLWIGSAGLAAALLHAAKPARPALAVIGSVSTKTMEQIAYCKARGVVSIKLPAAALHCGEETAATYLDAAVAALRAGTDVIITAAETRRDYESFAAYGRENGLTNDDLAAFTKTLLSEAAQVILEKVAVRGAFLTGGDTAIAVIRRLQATGSRIEKEIRSGFVQGRLIGGIMENLLIVTKAGAFGSETDIYDCMKKMD
ncbi:four-carbon acid sugar kinase family protein [Megasphaera vaginalis (ex Bordigoni et al. 2020)]|uniref:four-carbon acid sugar kinase family protein n=1 Tax=Megasphaera vaginalis (ex Bordigoni et al. 2020) TaxID=2045301 RepID=UPI000C7A3776|nr:four-carbon acid sugar kinase family protein [Megasphaera vaginalis (ex Bordigoni et al. 2020)]